MKTLIIPKGEGKTTELIKKSADTGNYIVCQTMSESNRIQVEAKKMGLQIPLPISYYEFLKKDYDGKGITGFLIDNADMFLQSLSAVPINCITVSS